MKDKVALLLGLLGVLLASCQGDGDLLNDNDIRAAYNFEFGFMPVAGMEINARQIQIQDSVTAWLKFKLTDEFQDKIVEGLSRTSEEEFFQHSAGGDMPGWWIGRSRGGVLYYKKNPWKREFSDSWAVVAIDVGEGVVYFCHDASY